LHAQLIEKLREAITRFLEKYVTKPTIDTATGNIEGQASVANLNALIGIIDGAVQSEGIEYDAFYLRSLSKKEIEARINALSKAAEADDGANEMDVDAATRALSYLHEDRSNKYLFSYAIREFNWITVSLLSASYISTLVLTRSAFELAIGIGSRERGSMQCRLGAMHFLTGVEAVAVKDQWYRLCAWGHPYGKWAKEICPIFLRHEPTYHPVLFSLCLDELTQLSDLFCSIAVEKYDLDREKLSRLLEIHNVSLDKLPMLRGRLSSC
jgi:hypothetical protein